jgi:hypothetical protein
MDEQKIKNLVKVWYEKAKHETDEFSKFVFLWFCFNAWLAYRTEEDRDRDMLEILKARDPKTGDITAVYDNGFASQWFKDRITELQSLCPIYDPRNKYDPVIIGSMTDFPNICEAIYRIRCTLFHGGKSPDETRDRKLVIAAGNILGKWVGNLVSSW